MIRLLGFVVIVLIWGEMAPWGLLVGGILLAGWLLVKPAPLSKTHGLRSQSEQLRVTDAGSSLLSAIPLQNAVYCVNCDLITNSPHDACGVCGSHSVVGVSRMWQLTLGGSKPTNAARYKVNLAVDVREIPANGLSESTKLLGRLAELGGDVKTLHIKVDPIFSSAILSDARTDVLKPARRPATSVEQDSRPRSQARQTRKEPREGGDEAFEELSARQKVG
jgi:hypothetical protein